MYFKADYGKMSDLSRASLNKCNELESLYSDVIAILREVQKNWISDDDAYIYVCQMVEFMQKRTRELEGLTKGSYVLNRAAILYGDQDDKWEKMVLKSSLADKLNLIEDGKNG